MVPTTRLRMVARESDLCCCLQQKHATSFGISEKGRWQVKHYHVTLSICCKNQDGIGPAVLA